MLGGFCVFATFSFSQLVWKRQSLLTLLLVHIFPSTAGLVLVGVWAWFLETWEWGEYDKKTKRT